MNEQSKNINLEKSCLELQNKCYKLEEENEKLRNELTECKKKIKIQSKLKIRIKNIKKTNNALHQKLRRCKNKNSQVTALRETTSKDILVLEVHI